MRFEKEPPEMVGPSIMRNTDLIGVVIFKIKYEKECYFVVNLRKWDNGEYFLCFRYEQIKDGKNTYEGTNYGMSLSLFFCIYNSYEIVSNNISKELIKKMEKVHFIREI